MPDRENDGQSRPVQPIPARTFSRDLDIGYSPAQAFLHSMEPKFLGTKSSDAPFTPMALACMALFRSMPEEQQDRVLTSLGWAKAEA